MNSKNAKEKKSSLPEKNKETLKQQISLPSMSSSTARTARRKQPNPQKRKRVCMYLYIQYVMLSCFIKRTLC
jgi:hypothetical protein